MNINQHFDMVALSPTNHRQALETALQIFRHDPTAKEDIREAYKRALYPERYLNQGKRAYWLLVDKKTKRIAGTIGLYTQGPDRKEPYGLGWFGVSDEFRSLGLGKYLLQWVLDEVKRRNKSVLRIETSDLSYATTAVALYKRFGCVQIAKIPQMKHHRILYNKLILEKRLVHGRAFSDYKKTENQNNSPSKILLIKRFEKSTYRLTKSPMIK